MMRRANVTEVPGIHDDFDVAIPGRNTFQDFHRTVEILKRIAARDSNVKIIVNARNFGHIRSPHHALLLTTGDAVIGLVADLQDPPEMIPDFIREWEKGFMIVVAIKKSSEEHQLMFWLRKKYYRLVNQVSSIETFENFTGFGLYDRKVIEEVRRMGDANPYFRGNMDRRHPSGEPLRSP